MNFAIIIALYAYYNYHYNNNHYEDNRFNFRAVSTVQNN